MRLRLFGWEFIVRRVRFETLGDPLMRAYYDGIEWIPKERAERAIKFAVEQERDSAKVREAYAIFTERPAMTPEQEVAEVERTKRIISGEGA